VVQEKGLMAYKLTFEFELSPHVATDNGLADKLNVFMTCEPDRPTPALRILWSGFTNADSLKAAAGRLVSRSVLTIANEMEGLQKALAVFREANDWRPEALLFRGFLEQELDLRIAELRASRVS
jgi:hypothetical protein